MNFFKMFSELDKALNDWFSSSTYAHQSTLNLSKEESTFEKNGYKTTVTVYFYENGLPAGTSLQCIKVGESDPNKELEILNKQIEEAVAAEDFIKAANLHKEKKALELKIAETLRENFKKASD